jgi:hypothetical protein
MSFVFLAATAQKPRIREHWLALVPIWALFGAAIAALYEWQVDDETDKPDDEGNGDVLDA